MYRREEDRYDAGKWAFRGYVVLGKIMIWRRALYAEKREDGMTS
jgi:hypothetical protein